MYQSTTKFFLIRTLISFGTKYFARSMNFSPNPRSSVTFDHCQVLNDSKFWSIGKDFLLAAVTVGRRAARGAVDVDDNRKRGPSVPSRLTGCANRKRGAGTEEGS